MTIGAFRGRGRWREHLTAPVDRPHARCRQENATQRTQVRASTESRNRIDPLPRHTRHEQRSIAQPAMSTRTAGRLTSPGSAAKKEQNKPNAFAYTPFVRRRTIRIHPAHAPSLAEPLEDLLPHQRLHELPGATSGARPRRLPRLRVQAEPALSRAMHHTHDFVR